MQQKFISLLLKDKGYFLSELFKALLYTHRHNSTMIKTTKRRRLWGDGGGGLRRRSAGYSVVGLSEININEADFTAAPSPLRFDLLDSHLLGRPVRLQKRGEGTREEEGL